jgi:signal peptidase I
MNETPEDSPPAFLFDEPAEADGPIEDASDRMPRAGRGGLPKLPATRSRPLAKELPRPLAKELPRPLAKELPGPLAKEWRNARHGTWRVAVAEESMAPALAPADWLLLDPTCDSWPRRGSIVVFREPDSGLLAIKRVAARPGDRVRIEAGILHLAPDEAWLLGDNGDISADSRRYGPVPLDALVGRAWFRYAPMSRIGRIGRR